MSVLFLCALLAVVSGNVAHAQTSPDGDKTEADADQPMPENPFPNRTPAPSLDGGVGWLNTSGEITKQDLRGKIVLLDFWTYCCINCMHVLPDLEYLEKKYADQIVVIGVHSAKFDNEKETENIREAILRYEIEHPVINDARMQVWRKFGVRAWPSLVLLDPEGFYCGYISGEGNREILDSVISRVIDYHRAKGTLDETPIHFQLERRASPRTPLRYPGKVLADSAGKRLFISDSNNNRLVVTDLQGRLLATIGSGQLGTRDGRFDEAQFDHPQGMALHGDTLYVADTENHLIRTVDLQNQTVGTLAGTGEQARTRPLGGPLQTTALNSPWDLAVEDGVLYIAMAGPHQIWKHVLGTDRVERFAGSGREDITNGPLGESALAQPSGLAVLDSALYVCDSEGSAIRKIELPNGPVSTIAGTSDLPNGRSLFEFGDVDGPMSESRLQHPLGIVAHAGKLYIADTYNHKIKQWDPETGVCATWAGTGERGAEVQPLQFSEPAGLAIVGNDLLVADTNNHRIVAIDLKTRAAREFKIEGLQPPVPVKNDEFVDSGADKPLVVPATKLSAAGNLQIELSFQLPSEYKLNSLLPVSYRIEGATFLKEPLRGKAAGEGETRLLKFDLPTRSESGELRVTATFGYCRDGSGGLCKLKTTSWNVPVEFAPDGETTLKLTAVADE